MIIFGGFKEGERTNEIATYNMKSNVWQIIQYKEGQKTPCPRSGHAAIFYPNKRQMYIFGGKDSNSQKLNDLWAFDMESSTWSQILPVDGRSPDPRSGHSACYFEGYILVFGGILEVTKELNDVQVFVIKEQKWIQIYEDFFSPSKQVRRNTLLNSPDRQ